MGEVAYQGLCDGVHLHEEEHIMSIYTLDQILTPTPILVFTPKVTGPEAEVMGVAEC